MTGSPDQGLGLLGIYLNDHLAGSTAGVELANRIAAHRRSAADSAPLQRLAAEIADDRTELRRIMERLGVRGNPAKVALGWLGEKIGRLKPNGRLLTRSPLSDVVEMEALQLGVAGKAAAWRMLRVVAEVDDRIDAAEMERLAQRAERQFAALEGLRARAAAEVVPVRPG
jgi:hypothetical protein